jgi:hypothetical protein
MKKTVLVLAALLTGFAAFAQSGASSLPRLAVVEFSTNISNDKVKADAITVRNLVQSNIVATGRYDVMTRDDIDKLLENQRIQMSSITSKENLQKLELQNIKYLITGTVDAMDNDYIVSISILDVSTGRFPHSADQFMSSGSQAIYNGVRQLVTAFVAGITSEGGQVAQVAQQKAQRPGSGVSAAGIGIEVSVKHGGILYFQGEEIATLWDNDSYTIPIERPGTYTVKVVFGENWENTKTVTINTRGITKLDIHPLSVGDTGPAGGLIFYDKGSYSDGWRYLEAAPSDMSGQWSVYERDVSGTNTVIGSGKRNTQVIVDSLKRTGESGRAAQLCASYTYGGYNDWFLPSQDELNLIYKNLTAKGLGSFTNSYYWSSSQSNYSAVWCQNLSAGNQIGYEKKYTLCVRAVRAF